MAHPRLQHHRLGQIQARPVHPRRQLPRRRHHRNRLVDPGRHPPGDLHLLRVATPMSRDGQAILQPEPVDQPPQRGRHMRVRAAHARMHRHVGRRGGRTVVKRLQPLVARAAQQARRILHHRHPAGRIRVDARQKRADLGNARIIGQLVPQRARRHPKLRQRSLPRRPQRPQHPDAGLRHHLTGDHARQQRNLRIEIHHRRPRIQTQLPPAIPRRHHRLRRQPQIDRFTTKRRPLPGPPDLRKQRNRRMRGPGVERLLHRDVLQPRHRPHQSREHVAQRRLAIRVDDDVPDDGRAVDVGKQTARTLRQRRRMQARRLVRQIDRLPAAHRLGRRQRIRRDEPADVRDRVQHAPTGGVGVASARVVGASARAGARARVGGTRIAGGIPSPRADVHRLIQIHGTGRVDGDERYVAQIPPRRPTIRRSRGIGVHLRGERLRHPELAGDGTEIKGGRKQLHARPA